MSTILITGCSTGFGHQAAKHLSSEGHHVIATMRNVDSKNLTAAEALRKHAKDNDLKLEVMEADVTSDESIAALSQKLPTIDVLINNAGRGFGGPVEAFSSQQVMDQLDLNVVGTIRMAKAVLPGMRAQKSGLIIQLSSIAGIGAFPSFGVYHASKWGLEGLSEALRYEVGPLGIDVCIIEPGPFSTEFFPNIVPPSDSEMAQAYQHITAFMEGFGSNVQAAFADENAPTDPILVVEAMARLINTPAGQRPLRQIVGMDFGFQAINDAYEPIRQSIMKGNEIDGWDGAK